MTRHRRKSAPQTPGNARRRESPPRDPLAAWFFRWQFWLFAAALALVVLLVYQPVWHGGFIWDDDRHVRPDLQSWLGLWRIWVEPRATQQYYPLTHSVFWLEYAFWGDSTLGYHLVNILLHAAAAVLVAAILRRLAIPGAYLAAAVFALHPVHVESVAWISELKNTLSAVFYLGAALFYLRFDAGRGQRCYFAALALFVLGLMTKTVTATLPAALLVVFWWQRGRLSWRRDVAPLLPFFALGAAAGITTAWVERVLGGAVGPAFDLTFVERCLIAGRAICFYLGKLFWPTHLVFFYPRWQVSQAVWWQYLFPLGVAVLLAGLALVAIRHRRRGPLAAMLFFCGTLFPGLGFCNVYPFNYSFVADHFQYLASLGIIVLVAAGAARWLADGRLWGTPAAYVPCGFLLLVLAVLTNAQSAMYADIEKLYRTTIDRNPDCWIAHNNLGWFYTEQGRVDKAIEHFERAIEIKPDGVEAHDSLGTALANLGRVDEAMAQYRETLRIKPDYASGHYGLGNVHLRAGRWDDAAAEYRETLRIKPDHAGAYNNLGATFARQGQWEAAIVEYRRAIDVDPNYATAYGSLGNALARLERFDEAAAAYRRALELSPDFAEARQNLQLILSRPAETPPGR